MKATDLMIGDWVCVTSSDGLDTHFFKITTILERGVNSNGFVEFEDIEPIPLTREMLECNGFRDTYKDRSLAKDNIFKWYNMYGHCVMVDKNTNTIKIQHDRHVLLDLRYNIVISVHELQHALKFCGIEKEIVL